MTIGLPRAALAYHHTTTPAAKLSALPWQLRQIVLGRSGDSPEVDFADIDLFALLVNAQLGISPEMIEIWSQIQERQIPRFLLVQNLDEGDIDFDDIVLIGTRVLEPLATPYLVIHGASGEPIGLIELATMKVHNYESGSAVSEEPDSELAGIVSDFRDEYMQDYASLGDDAFENGIYTIALPISTEAGFGFRELETLLLRIPRR